LFYITNQDNYKEDYVLKKLLEECSLKFKWKMHYLYSSKGDQLITTKDLFEFLSSDIENKFTVSLPFKIFSGEEFEATYKKV